MPAFVDIHCHVLPGIDDGPETVDESLRMLRIARSDGITTIVATPHVRSGFYNTKHSEIERAILNLMQMMDKPTLLKGADVTISPNLLNLLKSGSIPLVNQKRYLLLEMSPYSMPSFDWLQDLFYNMHLMNIYPIITHPERNMIFIEDRRLLMEVLKRGALCQVTAMSITGEFGGKVQAYTRQLLKTGLVHVVATDAHDSIDRPPVLSRAYEKTRRMFNQDMADRLFVENPGLIIEGRIIEPVV